MPTSGSIRYAWKLLERWVLQVHRLRSLSLSLSHRRFLATFHLSYRSTMIIRAFSRWTKKNPEEIHSPEAGAKKNTHVYRCLYRNRIERKPAPSSISSSSSDMSPRTWWHRWPHLWAGLQEIGSLPSFWPPIGDDQLPHISHIHVYYRFRRRRRAGGEGANHNHKKKESQKNSIRWPPPPPPTSTLSRHWKTWQIRYTWRSVFVNESIAFFLTTTYRPTGCRRRWSSRRRTSGSRRRWPYRWRRQCPSAASSASASSWL